MELIKFDVSDTSYYVVEVENGALSCDVTRSWKMINGKSWKKIGKRLWESCKNEGIKLCGKNGTLGHNQRRPCWIIVFVNVFVCVWSRVWSCL